MGKKKKSSSSDQKYFGSNLYTQVTHPTKVYIVGST